MDALTHCPPPPLGSPASGPSPGLPPRLRGRCALHTLPHLCLRRGPPSLHLEFPLWKPGGRAEGLGPTDASVTARGVISVKYICKTHLLIFRICLSTVEICIRNCFTLQFANQRGRDNTTEILREERVRAERAGGQPGGGPGAGAGRARVWCPPQPTFVLTCKVDVVTPCCG